MGRGHGQPVQGLVRALAPALVPLDLTNFTSTEDANSIIVSDFAAGASAGDVTVTINASGQTDGVGEGAIKGITIANLAALIGKPASSLTDGSHLIVAVLTLLAELPRYTFLGVGLTDGAAQATLEGGAGSVWRNAAADNIQPQTHNNQLDTVPAGGGVTRTSETGVAVVLRYYASAANPFGVAAFSFDGSMAHGWSCNEPTLTSTPAELVLFAGCNVGAGTGGNATISVNVKLGAVRAERFPFLLTAL